MSKSVKWVKWVDPFQAPEKDVDADDEVRAYKDSYEKTEQLMTKERYNGPLLVGPMGVIPINETNSPSKVYNFWMLHTNFNLGKEVVEILEKCDGVETLDVFTRYRARIGIGKIFDEDKVKKRIKKALCKEEKKPIDPTKVDKLDVLKRHLAKKYKFWAIAVQKNEQLKLIGGETQEFVEQKVSEIEYEKLHTSWQ